jgi:hypothetical protein
VKQLRQVGFKVLRDIFSFADSTGFCRGYITRKKIKEIWRLANEQFNREETRRIEREKEIEEMNRILAKSNLKKTGEDEVEKQKTFTDEDAHWVNVKVQCFNSCSVEMYLSFIKESNIPKDENKRSLQIKCAARILEQPDIIPDPESTNYIPLEDEPKEGLIEIVIDEMKRILTVRQNWASETNRPVLDCRIKWEDGGARHKRIATGGIDDAASAYLQVDGLHSHRKYKFKVMVNSRFRPKPKSADNTKKSNSRFILTRDDPNEIRLSRAGYVVVHTQPDPPLIPVFLVPDVIHYDHKNPVPDSSPYGLTSFQPDPNEEEIEDILDDAGLTVVDKLEKYKDILSSKRTKTGTFTRFVNSFTFHSASQKIKRTPTIQRNRYQFPDRFSKGNC